MPRKQDAPQVGVVMGSDSDWYVMQHAAAQLASFDIAHETRVVSAHRMPDDMFAYAESAASRGLATALGNLDERSRRIIQARWLAEKDPKTLHELAGEFGVSAERIRQIEAKAMQKMRTALAESR